MKNLLVISLLLSSSTASAQLLRFEFTSDSGEWVGGGATRDISYTPQNTVFFNVSITQRGSVGPDWLEISTMLTPISTDFLTVNVGTNKLGHELRTGAYENAERAAFASAGKPGLDIGFQHRGSNTLTGRFDIRDIAFSNVGAGQWRLDRFRMDFTQFSEGLPLALRGTVTYNSGVPEPATLLVLGVPTLAMMRRRKLR